MTSYSTEQPPSGSRPRAGLAGIDLASAGMLIAFLGITFGVAAFGAITTIAAVDGWYSHAPHVPWTPPNSVFGIVWTVLYIMIGVSGWLVWRDRGRFAVRAALTFYVVQLVLNSLWGPMFFGGYTVIGLPALWVSLAIIVALDLVVVATVAAFWPIARAAALLLVPYLLWIVFASTLNVGDAALVALG